MARDPSPELELKPLNGQARTVEEWLTTFHLVFIALDPYTNESAWILKPATRILSTFQEADCRVAWLVTANEVDTRRFLGPWARDLLTFVDPERTAVKEFGLERLPALVHVAHDGKVIGAVEGWAPMEWRAITAHLAKVMAWSEPLVPAPGDPGPFEGSAALT